MKTKKTKALPAILKLILVLPVSILVLTAFSSCAAGKKSVAAKTEAIPPPVPVLQPAPGHKDGVAYTVVDEMPAYPGGNEALLRYVSETTRYPKEAKDKNITGRVIVRFIVKEDGAVTDASVIKGVDPLLDNEALRVVSSIPKFTPGKWKGSPVPVWYTIPIQFALRNDSRYQVIGNDTIYSFTKEMPQFPGGNDALQKFKTENLKYPPELKSLGLEGLVAVSFIIEKNGSVSDIKILRGTSPSLDEEAVRVTKIMPAWQPGKENGKPVKVTTGTMYEFLLSPRTPTVHKEGEPFVVVEEMPKFHGGDSALLAFVRQNTKYPESAKAKNIEGRVIIRFCITAEGGIDRVSVLKGVDPELDAEAIRVVSTLPAFKPGKQGGKAVPVWYMVPISFGVSKPPADGLTNPLTKGSAGRPKQEIPGYDEAPDFPGGEQALYKFINSNLVYPKSAKEKNISGKVTVGYLVSTEGSIDQVSVVKGIDPELDAEAVRVIKLLPAWKPGKLAGKPVKVWYIMPVTFTLK